MFIKPNLGLLLVDQPCEVVSTGPLLLRWSFRPGDLTTSSTSKFPLWACTWWGCFGTYSDASIGFCDP